MEGQLLTLSKVFTEKLFRIPDYQRGYSWMNKQIEDYWNDINNIEENKNHYIGVLTVEEVNKEVYKNWIEDLWIIEAKSYKPYYIVDGQQRLTTTIIAIQAIIELLDEKSKVNFTSKEEIRKKFIFESKSNEDLSRSYIFGYEKDNPSYNFLKSKIFNETLVEHALPEDTIYTKNLIFAKAYFIENLKKKNFAEIECFYKRLTQNLLFTIYTITEDIDVFIAFETMNNRGKPLSCLELLKNRLIYLSTRLKEDEHEKHSLRNSINEAWKSIYHYLGKNPDNLLDDDDFLSTHYFIYFGNDLLAENQEPKKVIRRNRLLRRMEVERYLLDKMFSAKLLIENQNYLNKNIINSYVQNLKKCVEIWFAINNPKLSPYTEDEKIWLDKINRMGINKAKMVLLSFYYKCNDVKQRLDFLKKLERQSFVFMFYGYRYFLFGDDIFIFDKYVELAIELMSDKINSSDSIKKISEIYPEMSIQKENFKEVIKMFQRNGFYDWDGIRYFLFEYEMSLQDKSKTKRQKLFWPEFTEQKSDYYTIEHIYPQQPKCDSWLKPFAKHSAKQKTQLRHSLGNLLPLSQAKNSSFNNKPFSEKKESNESIVGYKYGSYSEIEVSQSEEWTAEEILGRGLKLLSFLENRWNVKLGERKDKIALLNLDFLETQK